MDKKKFQKPVTCETCNIQLNSDQQAQQHYQGKQHYKMLKKQGKPVPEEYQAKMAARAGAWCGYICGYMDGGYVCGGYICGYIYGDVCGYIYG